ncbi:hypothetical protein PAXRUDRAFT_590533 [Paxillus rubicundulus Ve08.2h10]|uniref:Uncharacterized protein n=1 Tax=Paxillus rubicundulus Ve08.2h10 TaxID=930991 RepID=A0A0D0DZ51_9AGAM|nr:hypothetical protein PAXRUDRAFT_590533 [Paxillus rubicundulus Ve08.2h10]
MIAAHVVWNTVFVPLRLSALVSYLTPCTSDQHDPLCTTVGVLSFCLWTAFYVVSNPACKKVRLNILGCCAVSRCTVSADCGPVMGSKLPADPEQDGVQ